MNPACPTRLLTYVDGTGPCRWAAGSSRRRASARGCGGSGRAGGRCRRWCRRRRPRRPSWCASVQPGGRSQPSAVQPPSRTVSAIRCDSVWKRALRPTSSTTGGPPSTLRTTAGTTPAWQARRRATPAEMASPVSSRAVPSPVRSLSKSSRTTTVALRPAARGSRSAGNRSRRWQNPSPISSGRVVRARTSGATWPGPMRAWSALRSIAACRVGIRNRPACVPSPLSMRWRYVVPGGRALLGLEPTALRLVGGVGVDDLVEPPRQAAETTASCSPARCTKCFSARSRSAASTPGGRPSTARTMIRACSGSTAPSASAHGCPRVRARSASSRVASAASACAAPRAGGWRGEPGCGGGGRGLGGDVASVGCRSRSRSPASLASARARATSVSRCCEGHRRSLHSLRLLRDASGHAGCVATLDRPPACLRVGRLATVPVWCRSRRRGSVDPGQADASARSSRTACSARRTGRWDAPGYRGPRWSWMSTLGRAVTLRRNGTSNGAQPRTRASLWTKGGWRASAALRLVSRLAPLAPQPAADGLRRLRAHAAPGSSGGPIGVVEE